MKVDIEEFVLRLLLFLLGLRHVFLFVFTTAWLLYRITDILEPSDKLDYATDKDNPGEGDEENEGNDRVKRGKGDSTGGDDNAFIKENVHNEGSTETENDPNQTKEKLADQSDEVAPSEQNKMKDLTRKKSVASSGDLTDPWPYQETRRRHSLRETGRKTSTTSLAGEVGPGLFAGKINFNFLLECHGFQLGNDNTYADISKSNQGDLFDGLDRSQDDSEGIFPGGSDEALDDSNHQTVELHMSQLQESIYSLQRALDDLDNNQNGDQPLQRSCSEDILDKMSQRNDSWGSTEEFNSEVFVTGSGGFGDAANSIGHLYRRQISASLASLIKCGEHGMSNGLRNTPKRTRGINSFFRHNSIYTGEISMDDSDSSNSGSSEDFHRPSSAPNTSTAPCERPETGPQNLSLSCSTSSNIYLGNQLVSTDKEDQDACESSASGKPPEEPKPDFVHTRLKIFGLTREHREFLENHKRRGFKVSLKKFLGRK